MEKRKVITPVPTVPPVKVEPVAKDDTPLQVAKVLSVVAENSLVNTKLTMAAHRAFTDELGTHSAAIQAIANTIKPQSKIIDVTVTERDDDGRPSKYRIEVK